MTEYKVNAIAMKTDRAARRWNSFGQTAVKKNMVVKYMTLSKILCKWKQDSVISFFLYLDSAFKYKHKLVHNQSPV